MMPQNPWNISEKTLEDWVCKYPEYALWPDTEIIARQVQLKHGVLDILAYNGEQTFVVELKARKLLMKDLGQVLKYSHDISAILRSISLEYMMYSCPTDRHGLIDGTFPTKAVAEWHLDLHHRHGQDMRSRPHQYESIVPVLFGIRADKSFLAAAEVANVQVYLWHYEKDENVIDVTHEGLYEIHEGDFPEWAVRLSNKIVNDCVEDLEEHKKRFSSPQLLFCN